ncbi:Ribosome biogenesis protein [Venturia nashicola]|nr:Ribosome biogenesis protein [Venturia nashicola]
MDNRRPLTPEDMPSSVASFTTLKNSDFDRSFTTQTSAQLREQWDCQYDSDLLQRKNEFCQVWADRFIPQAAVDAFMLQEARMKDSYDHWVAEQSAMLRNFDGDSRLSGPGAEEVKSPGSGQGLIPSNLFTPERKSFSEDKHTATITSLENTIGGLKDENRLLNEHVQALDRQNAVSLATNSVIEQLQYQLARVKEQLNVLQASQASPNQTRMSDMKNSHPSDASKNDIDLLGKSFAGKFALIEKILGIDITTTGPKPGNLLELLHNRLWNLESALLPPHAPHYRGRQPYAPLTDFVKPGSTAAHRPVNYSVPPGQMAASFPYIMNSGPPQYPMMPAGYTNGHPMHVSMVPPPPQRPSFTVPKPKLEPQDVRYQITQPPRAAHHKVPHPLQHDPSIPKGPKAKTPDTQSQGSSRASSEEWPYLGADQTQTRPKSSNSRASCKKGATKGSKEDGITRPQSVPYGGSTPHPAYLKVPAQHQHHLPPHHQDPARESTPFEQSQSQPTQYQQPFQHPSPHQGGVSLKAFSQVPNGFDGAPAPAKKTKGLCGDENCDFC